MMKSLDLKGFFVDCKVSKFLLMVISSIAIAILVWGSFHLDMQYVDLCCHREWQVFHLGMVWGLRMITIHLALWQANFCYQG